MGISYITKKKTSPHNRVTLNGKGHWENQITGRDNDTVHDSRKLELFGFVQGIYFQIIIIKPLQTGCISVQEPSMTYITNPSQQKID